MGLFQTKDIIEIEIVDDNSNHSYWKKNSVQKTKLKLEEKVRWTTIFGSKTW